MNYQLKKAKASDKNNIYQLKKNNLYFYIFDCQIKLEFLPNT